MSDDLSRLRAKSFSLQFCDTVQEQSEKRPLILVAGFIHDVEDFAGRHPGGEKLVRKYVGKDATTAFVGGVYDHSNAARNVSLGHLLPQSCRTLTSLVVFSA